MKTKLKKLAYFLSLVLIVSVCNFTPVFAKTHEGIQVYEKIKSYLVPNLDSKGSQLEKSKSQLGNVVKTATVYIDNIYYNYPNIQVKGSVKYNGNEKPFQLEGTLKNTGERDNNRVIVVAKDTYDNFEVLDYSFYSDMKYLNPFDTDILSFKNQLISTLYLLDKDSRNFISCENVANDNISKEILNVLNNQNELETAQDKDILWISKIMKFSEFQMIKPVNRFYAGETYRFSRYLTHLGVNYEDSLTVEVSVRFDNYLPVGGTGNGETRITYIGGTFTNLSTNVTQNTFTSIGRTQATNIELYLSGVAPHGFTSSTTYGNVYQSSQLTSSISIGFGIPYTGINYSLEWTKPVSSASINLNGSAYRNNPNINSYTLSIISQFGSGNILKSSGHYLSSTFRIADFNSSKENGSITAWFSMGFYCNFDGSTTTIQIPETINYYQ